MCPVSMVTPVQAAGAGGREGGCRFSRTDGGSCGDPAPSRARAGADPLPKQELQPLLPQAEGAESAAGAEPGARGSWAARAQGAARHAPGPDGGDAPSRAGGWQGLGAWGGHCPRTAALGGAGPGGGRPSWAPSPGAESPRPGGMGRAAAAA